MSSGKRQNPKTRPTIGVLADRFDERYQVAVLEGIADAAAERDANLFCLLGRSIHSPYGFESQSNVLYDLVGAENVDGLIFVGGTLSHFIGREGALRFCERYRPLPMVNIAQELEGIPSILVDNVRGMRDIVSHLIEAHGCRRIAFIRGPEGSLEADARYQAYCDALAEHGIPLDPNLVAPGDFRELGGEAAIALFLDQRKVDCDAIVAANDGMALGALEALRARGIQVPGEVALAGFDDIDEAQSATPPLTTVRQPLQALGRRAVEILLARLADEEVPERVTLPTEPVVRRSCGCLSQAILEATAEKVEKTSAPFDKAFSSYRERIVFAVAQAIGLSSGPIARERAEQLVDAFVADVTGKASDAFLTTLDELLRQVVAADSDVTMWQGMLSVLRQQMLPLLSDGEALLRAENLWQQARILVAETMQRVQAQRGLRAEHTAQVLSAINEELLTALDVAGLMDLVAQQLPRLGIKSCYISLYDGPETPPEWSRLVMAYDENGRVQLEADGQRFPSRQLVPPDLLPRNRRYTMVIGALYFRENQLGVALFEMGPREGIVYETLRSQLSSALQRALLFEERKRAEEVLQESERRLETILSSVQAGIVVIDAETHVIVDANPVAIELIGEPKEQIVGHVCHKFICPAEVGKCPITDLGQTVDRSERVLLNASGERVPILKSVVPIVMDGRQYLLESFFDITERKAAEAERERLLAALERRAVQLQTATEVSRAASSILNPEELIQRVVDLIRERFDLYYVGLFLVDQTGEWSGEPNRWAVLQAGTGEAGRQMLAQGHKLEIGGASMIGWCIANKQARIALDVGAEAVRFENPLLPQTRSELAFPLISRGEVIGALTIQSAQEAAFSQEDIAVLQAMADHVANAIANARLFEQVQVRAEELAVLDEMGRALTVTLDLDTVLEHVYRHTSRLIDTTNFYIALYDAQKDEVSFPFYYVERERIRQTQSRRGGKGLTEYVIRTRQPLLVKEDIAAQVKELGIEMIGREAQSWLGVPMITGDQVLGVIAVQSYTTPRVYNEHHRDLLSAIANQTAIAVQNARLLEQAQARAAELAVLNEVGQALTARLSMDEVLNEVHRGVSRLMDATNFYLALYDADKGEITFPLDVTQEERDKFQVLSADEGLTGYIIRNRTSVLIQGNLPERLAEMGVEMVGQPALSWLGVPMMIGDRVLGVLGVQSYTSPHAYDEHDRDLLTVLANQAAIAIQNAHLFEQVQRSTSLLSRRITELDLLNEVGRRIDEAPSVPELLEWVAERIPSAMRHPEMCVAAIEFAGQVYGTPRAMHLPRQMVGGLRIGGERVGQVYVAYTEEHDFLDEESALLGDIARRLGAYIENRRLLERMQAALQEVEATHQRYLRQAWSEYLRAAKQVGYETGRPGVPSLGDAVLPEIRQALEQRRVVVVAAPAAGSGQGDGDGKGYSALVAPITLRGTVIGALGVHADDSARRWTADEIALVEAIAERMALAAENLRLLDETQRGVARERLVGEITDKMRRATSMDELMQVTAQGLAAALGISGTFVQVSERPGFAQDDEGGDGTPAPVELE